MKKTVLPASMMVTSIIGFIISAVYIVSGAFDRFFMRFCNVAEGCPLENLGTSLGFAFCCAFVIMFIASIISITPTDAELGKK